MTRRAEHYPSSTGCCADCGKQTYRSRKAAKRASKIAHPGDVLHPYECTPGVWHYGHHRWRVPGGTVNAAVGLPAPAAAQMRAMAHRDAL